MSRSVLYYINLFGTIVSLLVGLVCYCRASSKRFHLEFRATDRPPEDEGKEGK